MCLSTCLIFASIRTYHSNSILYVCQRSTIINIRFSVQKPWYIYTNLELYWKVDFVLDNAGLIRDQHYRTEPDAGMPMPYWSNWLTVILRMPDYLFPPFERSGINLFFFQHHLSSSSTAALDERAGCNPLQCNPKQCILTRGTSLSTALYMRL